MSMEPNTREVKPKRRYDSRLRADRARASRLRLVEAARRLFLQDGYPATTVAKVAASVGVSVETVYKAFGGKPGLVQAIADAALAGVGSVPAETRSNELHRAESDPRAIIRGWGRLTCEVAPRIAPVLLLVRDASADPEMATLKNTLEAQRQARMTENARRLSEGGHLRADITVEYAADVLWTYSSPELYELLVIKRAWSMERYGDFVADAMISALLPPSARGAVGDAPEPSCCPSPSL
jgi:AcrR family transcriptional regulator